MDPAIVEAVKKGNPVVFFDISIGGVSAGRIKMELFKSECPKVSLIPRPPSLTLAEAII